MIREAWRSRRSSVIFMAAVLVIAGLLAVKVIFFPEQSRESAAPSASASASPSLSAVAASAGSVGADGRAVCDVKVPAGKEFSAEVPSDYTWTATSDGARYPVSATYGPTVQVGHTGQCFAHNPTGAAMAAISMMHSESEPQASEAERRALLSARTSNEPLDTPTPQSLDIQVFGYAIQGYSPERATVQVVLLSRSPQHVVVRFTIRVVWEDGDWRYDVDDADLTPQIVTNEAELPKLIFTQRGSA